MVGYVTTINTGTKRINRYLGLQATQDDATASKEVINVLRKQVQTLQREKETLSAMKPELSEGQLLDILRWE